MQLLGFSLPFPVGLVVAVEQQKKKKKQKPALDVGLVAFGSQTLEIQEQTFVLSSLSSCEILI